MGVLLGVGLSLPGVLTSSRSKISESFSWSVGVLFELPGKRRGKLSFRAATAYAGISTARPVRDLPARGKSGSKLGAALS
jgi:hypothetical protein